MIRLINDYLTHHTQHSTHNDATSTPASKRSEKHNSHRCIPIAFHPIIPVPYIINHILLITIQWIQVPTPSLSDVAYVCVRIYTLQSNRQ